MGEKNGASINGAQSTGYLHVKEQRWGQAVMAHAFNPSTWEAEAGRAL